jgi:biotin transport system substrate-specific component
MTKAVEMILHKDIVRSKAACHLIAIFSFIALTTIGGYVRIPLPFTPVPITLQTFFVILAGAFLGSRLGILSQATYLGLGILGLPVFQGYAGGIAHFAGPTGGYLAAFIIAPLVVGKLISVKKDTPSFWWSAFSMAVGAILILFMGLIHLMSVFGLGFREGMFLGVLCFIPGDFLKVMCGAALYMAFNKRIKKAFSLE